MVHRQPEWTGRLAAALWLVSLLTATASTSYAQPAAMAVEVLLINQAAVDDATLRAARTDVEKFFTAIDVAIVWVDRVPADNRLYVVCITSEPLFSVHVSPNALGAAASSRGVRGVRAYVFHPRVVKAVARSGAELRTVLAMAIAHELGHLLRPTADHDPDGLMRESWTPRELALASRGALAFSRRAGAAIRSTLRR
jgi:hypothetical protein